MTDLSASVPSGEFAWLPFACGVGAIANVIRNRASQRKTNLGDDVGAAIGGCLAGMAVLTVAAFAWRVLLPLLGTLKDRLQSALPASPLNIESGQLQEKFKHALDFGVDGPWNKANATAFENAIQDHVASNPGVSGTFRQMAGTWHLDPRTMVGVFVDEAGNFVTGFRLNQNQLLYFPNIGGG